MREVEMSVAPRAANAPGRVPRLQLERSARKPCAACRMQVARALRLVVRTLPVIALALTPHLSLAGGDPFPPIPGWKLTGQPVAYSPDNLWDFIDGAAESYLAYSFVDLQVGEYLNPDSVAVRVELYRHADPENAFGIYSTERAPDYSFLKVGAQGYEEEGVLNFVTGRYYVKLSTRQKGPGAATTLRTIAGHVDAHLAEGRDLPAGLKRLPGEGRQPNTEGFVAQNFLGYAFLHNAYTALYEKELQLFLMEFPTADSAAAALRRLLVAAPGPQTGSDRYSITDPNNGPIGIARRGPLLYGIVGAPETETERRYLGLIEGALPQK